MSKKEPSAGNITFKRCSRDKGKFTIIKNSLINNQELTVNHRFLLIYILSKPENWTINIKDLGNVLVKGTDTIYRYLKELEAKRYIKRQTIFNPATGHRMPSQYIISDAELPENLFNDKEPKLDYPILENPILENPNLDNPLNYKDLLNTKTDIYTKTDQYQETKADSDSDDLKNKQVQREKLFKEEEEVNQLEMMQQDIYHALVTANIDFNCPDAITHQTAIKIATTAPQDIVKDKIYWLGQQIDQGKEINKPMAYLISMIKKAVEQPAYKQKNKPVVYDPPPPKKITDDLPLLTHFSDLKVIAGPTQKDGSWEIAKWLLRDFDYHKNNSGSGDKNIFLLELGGIKDLDKNNYIEKAVNNFFYPKPWASDPIKKAFIDIYKKL